MRILKPEYQKVRDDFAEQLEQSHCCSCNINPPCEYCIHEGNPINLFENDDAWEESNMKVECHSENCGLIELEKVFKTVGVKYRSSPGITYTFMTDEECKVGDKAVVFTNGNWNVVIITEVHDKPQFDLKSGIQYTWLVQIVDRTNYDRHIKEDGEGYPSAGERL